MSPQLSINSTFDECSEMSVASEELARDNCTVSDELVQLREDKASHSQNMEVLQVRFTVALTWFWAETVLI